MALVTWMQPRDHRDAARTMGLLVGVAVVTTVVTLPVSARGGAEPVLVALAGVAFAVMIVLALTARLLRESSRLAWTVSPLLAVAANTLIGLATQDVTIGAQVFFVFCAVYGGALLPPPGVVVMTVASVVGEAVLVLALLPPGQALNDLAYVAAALVTTSYLLGRGAGRVEAIVHELHERASTDSLTGLVNRRTFDAALQEIVDRQDHVPGTALILVDIDHFKRVNDEFGHPGGDEVLVQLSELVVSTARRDDVVCRLGGDEIAVLMPDCPPDLGRRRAAEIVEGVREHPFTIGPASGIRLSVSAGVAHAPTTARTSLGLYAVADAALYEAKRAGRDRLVQRCA